MTFLSENRCFGIGKSFLVAQLFQSAFMQCLLALEMLLQLQASEQGVVCHPLDMSHCHMCKSPPTRDWLRQHCCTIGALHCHTLDVVCNKTNSISAIAHALGLHPVYTSLYLCEGHTLNLLQLQQLTSHQFMLCCVMYTGSHVGDDQQSSGIVGALSHGHCHPTQPRPAHPAT